MTLQDFLIKARDRDITIEVLRKYFKEMMYHNLAYYNLAESEKSFIFDIILKYRAKLFAYEHLSSSDLEEDYYRIWIKRQELKLEEDDLKKIKEILYSFKSK